MPFWTRASAQKSWKTMIAAVVCCAQQNRSAQVSTSIQQIRKHIATHKDACTARQSVRARRHHYYHYHYHHHQYDQYGQYDQHDHFHHHLPPPPPLRAPPPARTNPSLTAPPPAAAPTPSFKDSCGRFLRKSALVASTASGLTLRWKITSRVHS